MRTHQSCSGGIEISGAEEGDDDVGGPIDFSNRAVRDRLDQLKLLKRIDACNRWKRENHVLPIPESMDIDTLAPGTEDIGGGGRDSSYVAKEIERRQKVRAIHQLDHDRQRTVAQRIRRQKQLDGIKRARGGTLGVYLTSDLQVKCAFAGRHKGPFSTFAAAAAAYDAVAVACDGKYAVLNDADAVAIKDADLIERKAKAAKMKARMGAWK